MLGTMFSRPDNVFDQLDTIHRLLSRSLGADAAPSAIRSVGQGSFPEVNVGRTPTSVEVFAFAPGVDASSLDVTIERNVLIIAGTRACTVPDRESKAQLYANERPAGRFSRAITLPDDVDPLRVEAKYRDGILRISVALSAAAQPQRVAVQ